MASGWLHDPDTRRKVGRSKVRSLVQFINFREGDPLRAGLDKAIAVPCSFGDHVE